MPNIEIKVRYPDLKKAQSIAEKCKTQYLGVIHQIDTYFHVKNGRLKLREISDQGAWLIPYSKSYEKTPTRSNYQLLEVKDPVGVKSLFTELLGLRGVVEKKREVFLIENVRVHLDEVKNLGTFLEFEAVYDVDTEEVLKQERRKVEELIASFQIRAEDILTQGYLEMLNLNS